jgi:hypothetical protein
MIFIIHSFVSNGIVFCISGSRFNVNYGDQDDDTVIMVFNMDVPQLEYFQMNCGRRRPSVQNQRQEGQPRPSGLQKTKLLEMNFRKIWLLKLADLVTT